METQAPGTAYRGRNRFAARLVLAISLVLFLALALEEVTDIWGLPFPGVRGLRERKEEEVARQAGIVADLLRDRLRRWFEEHASALAALAERVPAREDLRRLRAVAADLAGKPVAQVRDKLRADPGYSEVRAWLQNLRAAHREYTMLRVVEPGSGLVLAAWPEEGVGTQSEVLVGPGPRFSVTALEGRTYLRVQLPLRPGTPAPATQLEIVLRDAEFMPAVLRAESYLGPRSAAFLADRDGRLITLAAAPGLVERSRRLAKEVSPQALGSTEGSARREAGGQKAIVAYRALSVSPEAAWSLIVSQELGTGWWYLRDELPSLLVLLLVGLGAASVLGALVVRSFSLPVRQLIDFAGRAEGGDLSVRAAAHSRDELGLLASGFNRMVERLQTARQQLEQQVAERTAELRARNRELQAEIDQRRAAEEELRQSRERLRLISESALDAIIMADEEGRILYANPAATAIFGYEREELVGRTVFETVFPSPKGEQARQAFEELGLGAGGGAPGRTLALQGRRHSGEVFPVEVSVVQVRTHGQRLFSAVIRDISERERSQEKLRLFAAAIEGAAEGIHIVELGGRTLYCNPAFAEQFGYACEEMAGRSVAELNLLPGALEQSIAPAIRRDGFWSGEVEGRGRDGRRLALWLSASVVRDAGGKATAMVAITKDLTAWKLLEEDHIKTQKLESISVLAGGLAHDFNNLLTIILGNLDLARLYAGGNADLHEALDHAAEASLRAGDLTRQLITFSKGGQAFKEVAALGPVVRDAVLFAAAGSTVACEFDLAEELRPVEFDDGQVRQVIHNLVQNAREAMPGGGTLRVRARNVALSRGQVPSLPAGDYVQIDLEDQGAGISEEHLHRIFDPYFSTKELGTAKGRGLGLAVTYSIVQNHGGAIRVASRPGEGAVFSLFLPAAEQEPAEGTEPAPARPPAPAPRPALPRPAPPGATRGRVLVMDDEELVLEMAGTALRQLGYEAVLCRSGVEAVVLYQIGMDSGRRFDLAFLDLTIPGGMGGRETFLRLREIDVQVRAVISSGYTADPIATEYHRYGFAGFIAKPFSIKTFEELLARLV